MKQKFLFINIGGDFLSIAWRIQKEGYECFSWYAKDNIKAGKTPGENIINIVPDLFDVLNTFKDNKKELIILIDDNSWGDTCDYLRSEGWLVIGSSHFADKVEHDRGFGNKLAKRIGLKTPPTYKFSDFPKAKEFIQGIIEKHPDARLVFKGDGVDLAGGSKTYTSKDASDCLAFVEWLEKDQIIHNYKIDTFEIQLFIQGTEADFACWFNGSIFINNIVLSFEEKKMNGLGAAQGCYGQIVTFEPASKSRFFREYFMKLLPILKKENSMNEWAANTIISSKNNMPYFLEWTPRFGWDSTFGELSILQDAGRSIAEFFITIASGKQFQQGFFPRNKYSAAVRLFSEATGDIAEKVVGKPISWNKSIDDNLWFYSIKKDTQDNTYQITGNTIGVATAVADTAEQAISDVYSIINPKNKLLNTPDILYNENIGKRFLEDYQRVKATKWF